MTVVKYDSEVGALQKADEDLLDVFQRNYLLIGLVPVWLTILQTVGCMKN